MRGQGGDTVCRLGAPVTDQCKAKAVDDIAPFASSIGNLPSAGQLIMRPAPPLVKSTAGGGALYKLIDVLSLVLPRNVVRHLNAISEGWHNSAGINTFFDLIKRIEHGTMPYEKSPPLRVEASEIIKLFSDIKAALSNHRRAAEAPNGEEATVAAYIQEPTSSSHMNHRPQSSSPHENQYRWPAHPAPTYDQRQRNEAHAGPQRNRPQLYVPHGPHSGGQQSRIGGPSHENKGPRRNYIARFGNPPSKCRYCGGLHFKHCPLMNPDLN